MVASTRKLSPAKSRNYLKKAEELYLETLEAQRSGRPNSAIMSAAHIVSEGVGVSYKKSLSFLYTSYYREHG